MVLPCSRASPKLVGLCRKNCTMAWPWHKVLLPQLAAVLSAQLVGVLLSSVLGCSLQISDIWTNGANGFRWQIFFSSWYPYSLPNSCFGAHFCWRGCTPGGQKAEGIYCACSALREPLSPQLEADCGEREGGKTVLKNLLEACRRQSSCTCPTQCGWRSHTSCPLSWPLTETDTSPFFRVSRGIFQDLC